MSILQTGDMLSKFFLAHRYLKGSLDGTEPAYDPNSTFGLPSQPFCPPKVRSISYPLTESW